MTFRYTTDGGTRETLEKGTIRGNAVFSGTFIIRLCLVFNMTTDFIFLFLQIFNLVEQLFTKNRAVLPFWLFWTRTLPFAFSVNGHNVGSIFYCQKWASMRCIGWHKMLALVLFYLFLFLWCLMEVLVSYYVTNEFYAYSQAMYSNYDKVIHFSGEGIDIRIKCQYSFEFHFSCSWNKFLKHTNFDLNGFLFLVHGIMKIQWCTVSSSVLYLTSPNLISTV